VKTLGAVQQRNDEARVEWRKAEAERMPLGFSLTAKPLLGPSAAHKTRTRKAA
jgi:hypothetical protein